MAEKKQQQRPPFQKFNPVDVDRSQSPGLGKVSADAEPGWKEVIAVEYLSVRSAPTMAGEVLLYLTRGRKYLVELSGKTWLKIKHPKLGERIGYVSASILKDQPVKE